MGIYSSESLQELRDKIDLVEVVGSNIDLKRAGAHYKACCPFHNEKTPSFVIQRGDSHYHCFGCGAHGDAIAFMMSYLKMSFTEAVETLAERFGVRLDTVDQKEAPKGPRPSQLKETLNKIGEFFHFYLLYTDEGQSALTYLYKRGLDLDFIKSFNIGFAPRGDAPFFAICKELKLSAELLEKSGLIKRRDDGKVRPFFIERITFPICDAFGNIIGFSGRKLNEDGFGPKYINTPETPIFKKSKTLIGLKECRRRIAKEKRVIVVEGQIDAFRLIQAGFNFTVAACGTAFGESHVHELVNLGVTHAFLAFDGDDAGKEAASKVGNLLQKEGVEVSIIEMEKGLDPDTLLRKEGPPAFVAAMENAREYLRFLVSYEGERVNFDSPAGKNEVVRSIVARIRKWTHPLMVHEGLKKLAQICQVPESVIDPKQGNAPRVYVKQSDSARGNHIDPDRILEVDLLRWVLLVGQNNKEIPKLAFSNLKEDDFFVAPCRRIFATCNELFEKNDVLDLLTIASNLSDAEQQQFLAEILQKRINPERARECLAETMQKILERNWMHRREEIKLKIQSGTLSEDQVLELAKEFDAIKARRPKVEV
ncbi:MAG: DNA primase [Simkaniaceae bacterium]|nr:DNA primase [Simkaniaceae bacterium]